MGCRDKGAGLGVPGLIGFVGEELPVPAQGDGINLSTRVSYHGGQIHTILCGELKSSVELHLSI